ncbi:SagB/ThcOx family dehydrogenase [Clostridium sp. JS66]|uniref:SagB/ThcOx family dehydrogenase n=1 Tax=Clostridium sp. JS66 TaxID=3064705 RepID=UPI00298E2611|nr:SagB/ThcOx family dehydrogenase [Clostridium sp. JS66]WPC42858.1 SagB/ThcOx family dehydrogenase [Clostridium sp. JS66]
MNRYKKNREFLKANFQILDEVQTDRQKGLPFPAFQKEYDSDSILIDLPEVSKDILSKSNVFDCLENRRSIRKYAEESISLEQLSYLLWATQGIQKVMNNNMTTIRRVPSGGAAHTFETYLIINMVEGLNKGIYRYLPLEHKLVFINTIEEMEMKIDQATPRQPFAPNFASKSAVLFAWSCIPYRAEYKFDVTAHKKILLDAGHLCQNLYIAAESVECGTCAIGIYDQNLIDQMLNLDGENEFIVYMAAIGNKQR